MSIEDLPPFIEHEIEYEEGTVREWRFFLSVNRQADGKWAVGYIHYASDEVIDGEPDKEMVIPQLFFNSADDLEEVAVRMSAKIDRFKRRENLSHT